METSKLKAIRGFKVLDAVLDIDDAGISFENGASLAIYNNFELAGAFSNNAQLLVGKIVTDVDESEYAITIKFGEDFIIRIDMRDDAYNGPEAIELRIPGEPIVIWN